MHIENIKYQIKQKIQKYFYKWINKNVSLESHIN